MDYNSLTVSDLKKIAKDQRLSGYSNMRKHELISLLLRNQTLIVSPSITEKNNQYNLESLPIDMQIEILSSVDLTDLERICASNKYFAQLCQNKQLWAKLLKKYYPERPSNNLTLKENYTRARNSQLLKNYIDINFDDYIRTNLKNIFSLTCGVGNDLTIFVNELAKCWIYNDNGLSKLSQLYSQLKKDPVMLEFYLNAPIPDLHFLSIVIYNVDNSIVYQKYIDKYDINLLDLINAFENLNLGNFGIVCGQLYNSHYHLDLNTQTLNIYLVDIFTDFDDSDDDSYD